jgi:hypothetical protein
MNQVHIRLDNKMPTGKTANAGGAHRPTLDKSKYKSGSAYKKQPRRQSDHALV